MLKRFLRIQGFAKLGFLGITVLLYGCATPIDIKNASKAQMELIDSVDSAVADMQVALDQFHRDKEARILEEGRMLIAQQAIDVAVSNKAAEVTADELYDKYKDEIQPWVDYAFISSDIDKQIEAIQRKIDNSDDPVLKNVLISDYDDLRDLKLQLAGKPEDVAELEKIIQEDLENERETAKNNRKMLEILRAQLTTMKVMHSKVDEWLSIDVTVTQDQADALRKAVISAQQELKGGG